MGVVPARMHSRFTAATIALFAFATIACARHVKPSPPTASPALSATVAGTPSVAAATPVSTASASAATARGAEGGIETACNGIDDDGDGLVDVLLPTGPNTCSTSLKGACANGFAACEGGQRVCLGAAPMPEVVDGVDNDCNGIVDDVPVLNVAPRALVLAPRYTWTDAAPDIATVSAVLAQAGIPFDVQPPGTDWGPQLQTLDRYALAVVPGYLLGSAMGAGARPALEQLASRGGIVVLFKPVGTPGERQAWLLAGLRASVRRRDVLDIRFDGASPAPVTDLDSPEERTLHINDHAAPDAVESYLLDPDPSAGTVAVAHGFGGATSGAAITRRPVGKGAVYALGHDLATFGATRCDVNCFEPSGDVLRLFLEGAFREGAAGHVVLKHTAPGEESSVLLVTHDVDSPDAFRDGPWGPPGALQMARVEQARGVRATFDITTDYVAGYYDEGVVRELCVLGMCPVGAHGVTHPDDFAKLAAGTCTETLATYGAKKTLCGEIRVSRDVLANVTGRAPRVWRSPYLALPPQLFELLAKNGFAFDSGFGVGDLPYNLPLDLASVGFHQNRFRRSKLIEIPVACEDAEDQVENGKHRRVELDVGNRSMFATRWQYVLLRNAQNRSLTTMLLHPSRGRDLPPENLRTKVDALATFLDQAAATRVPVRPLEEMGDFWRARLDAAIEATYDSQAGYSGTLTIGSSTAPGLTLEFGDVINDFSCDACGEFRVRGKRVVIVNALTPGTKAAFTARVR
jgi:peptidoglycan/xylan/chitin deacetylase (PgdA/CDA1 family)